MITRLKRLTRKVRVSYFERYPIRFAPLIMKNTGTAKMPMDCQTTSKNHRVLPVFKKTLVLQ